MCACVYVCSTFALQRGSKIQSNCSINSARVRVCVCVCVCAVNLLSGINPASLLFRKELHTCPLFPVCAHEYHVFLFTFAGVLDEGRPEPTRALAHG